MHPDLLQAAWDGLVAGLLGLKSIVLIVLPLMVAIEFAKDCGVMERITSWFTGVAGLFKISEEAMLPLVVGFTVGFAYGSGVIIGAAKEGRLTHKDCYAINIFLSVCHSIFEDTLLLAALGASLFWLVASRLVLGVAALYLFGRFARVVPSKAMTASVSSDLS